MRIVVQRVREARVLVDGEVTGEIGVGLLVLLGVSRPDTRADADYLVNKLVELRIFPDDAGKMNRSVLDANGAVLVVSQFTLYGDCRRGRRPSFDYAAPPDQAAALYDYFVAEVRKRVKAQTGVFQAHMQVHLVNDGPVTLLLDSPARDLTPDQS